MVTLQIEAFHKSCHWELPTAKQLSTFMSNKPFSSVQTPPFKPRQTYPFHENTRTQLSQQNTRRSHQKGPEVATLVNRQAESGRESVTLPPKHKKITRLP